MEPNKVNPKRLKVLSLDGGGVKGLSSLILLRWIWKFYKDGLQRRGIQDKPLQPYDLFDLIGGTSTGGLTALMLGRLRMSIEDCIAHYPQISKDIFKDRRTLQFYKTLYSSSNLEEVVKNLVADRTKALAVTSNVHKGEKGNSRAPMRDPLGENCCKTAVLALPNRDESTVVPELFRTYYSSQTTIEPTIWEVARATTAAHTYFEPLTLSNGISYSDPGIGFNNPSRRLKIEAGYIWGDIRGRGIEGGDYFLFLSLGTGLPATRDRDQGDWKTKFNKIRIPLETVDVMYKRALNSTTVAEELERELDRSSYFRFNVDRGLDHTQLFEYEQLPNVEQDTNNYVNNTPGIKDRIIDCAERILEWHVARGPYTGNDPTQVI